MMTSQQRKILKFIRELLRKKPIFFDVETNGMDEHAEVVQVAAINHAGETLLDSLVKPISPIPYLATEVHGIDNEMVRNAPHLIDLWVDIEPLLYTHPVIIFNSSFVLRLLAQSAKQQGIFPQQPPHVVCAMLLYAEFYAEWDTDREAWVWQRLDRAAQQMGLAPSQRLHHARHDCTLTRALLLAMLESQKKRSP